MSIRKSKKNKTQKSITNPFDESVQLIILSKLEKFYQNLSKGQFQFEHIQTATKYLEKDLQILRHNKKDKRKINSLIVTLNILRLIKESLYEKALQQIQKQIFLFQKHSDNSDAIIQIKNTLIKSLILKKLKKEQESTELIKKAIQNIQVRLPKKPISKHHNKIIQLNLLAIAIIAEQFFSLNLQNQSYEIYKEAYHISNKYLTQYHKITETLNSILKKIQPQQKVKSYSKSKAIRSKRVSLGKSIRYDADLRHKTLQNQSIIIQQNHFKMKNNRLKTIQQGLSKSIKQKQFSKIYGEQSQRKCWTKLYKNQTSTLTSKVNSSFLNSQITYKNQPQQMKQLQKIKKLYLPILQIKKKKSKPRKVYYQKKNIVDVIITTSKMDTLRPQYFNLRSQNGQLQKKAVSSLSQSLILKNEAIQKAMKTEAAQLKTQKQQVMHLQNINLKKEDVSLINRKTQLQIKAKDQAGCQLI